MILNHNSKPKCFLIGLCFKFKQILTTTMKMSICFLIILFGVALADKPASRYGEPQPIVTYKPKAYRPVDFKKAPVIESTTYKPKAYRPVVFKKVPVIESTTPGNGGKFENLKAKIASKKEDVHSKLRKLKPFVLGFKAGAILAG